MKMKEVLVQTGLTERAVRFYTEQGLVSPAVSRSGGRTYYDYSREDVQRLTEISALRSMDFSVKDILALYSGTSPDVLVSLYDERLSQEAEKFRTRADALKQVGTGHYENASELAHAILNLPGPAVDPAAVDSAPKFGRLDHLTNEEREELTRQSSARLRTTQQGRRRLRIVLCALFCAVVISGAALWMYFAYQNAPLSVISSIPSIEFTGRSQITSNEQNELWVRVRLLNVLDGRPDSFSACFPDTPEGYSLWNSLFLNREYAMILLTVEIPRYKAAELGLLDGQKMYLDIQKVFDVILSDEQLSRQYARISAVQGDYS